MPVTHSEVFSRFERHDDSPASYEESTYTFLDRAKGDYWQRARNTIEAWASHLPESAYADVRGRLQDNDHSFRAAFFELWIHESLRRSGYAVEIHPHLIHSKRRPDFLASRDGMSFYIEAVTRGPAPRARARARRRARFIDAINRLDAGDWWLTLNQLTVGQHSVSTSGLRAELKRWLTSLSAMPPQEVSGLELHWALDDWTADFGAMPRGPKRGDNRSIGVYADDPARFLDDAGDIKAALEVKASEYGRLDAPFVIAAAVYLFDEVREDVEVALYGHRAHFAAAVDACRSERDGGFFGSQQRPAREHIAGVLVVNQLMPYHLDFAQATFARHPWIETALPPEAPFPAHEVSLHEGAAVFCEPRTVATEFFEIAE